MGKILVTLDIEQLAELVVEVMATLADKKCDCDEKEEIEEVEVELPKDIADWIESSDEHIQILREVMRQH